MPQMAPLSWLTVLSFFIIVFMMFNIMIFFNLYYLPKEQKKMKFKTIFNWKW